MYMYIEHICAWQNKCSTHMHRPTATQLHNKHTQPHSNCATTGATTDKTTLHMFCVE